MGNKFLSINGKLTMNNGQPISVPETTADDMVYDETATYSEGSIGNKISVLSTGIDGKISKSAQATKTSAMTSEVGIDANGKLWSAAGGGSVDYFTVVNGELCIVYEEN